MNGKIPPFGSDPANLPTVQPLPADPGYPLPREPLLLCEQCGDALTADVLAPPFTASGREEACCAGCWPAVLRPRAPVPAANPFFALDASED